MSSKLKNLQRRNLILLGLLVVLTGFHFVRPEATTSAREANLAFAFPSFDKAEASQVVLSKTTATGEAGARVVLQRGSGSQWSLESHFRYPLKTGADGLLDSIAAARIRNEVTDRQDTFKKYAGSNGWTEVEIIDARGQSILQFGLGRYAYPETFLRIGSGSDQRVVKAINISPGVARVESQSWIDTNLWPGLSATTMIRIDVDQRRDERVISLVKRGESPADVELESPEKDPEGKKVFWMVSPAEGDAVTLDVQDLAREFSGMLIDDVVAGSITGEEAKKYGFDDPELVTTFWSKIRDKVSKHVLEIGKRDADGSGWFARRKGAPWVFRIRGATAFQRMRQMPDEYLAKPEPADEPEDGDDAPKDGSEAPSGSPDGDEPKKDEPKPDDEPKKDEPKPSGSPDGDEPKKEEPKPDDEPQKDEPKPDDEPKKDEPKPDDEPKKDEPKPDDEPKKDG